NTELGADIEVSLHRFRPVLRLPWEDFDGTRKTLVSFRAGYRYKRSFDSAPPVHESRPDVECTLRWAFYRDIIVSNRARWEFRFVSSSPFSWRYRNQLKVEKDLNLNGHTFSAYVAAEP